MWKFIILMMIVGCGPFKKHNEPQDPLTLKREAIISKLERYINLEKDITDNYGFVDRGDGILFSCLKYVAGGEVNWQAAEKEPGRWERHPELSYQKPDPDLTNDSNSRFSKDMEVGLQWCFWHARDLSATTRHIEYLEAKNWDLCGGKSGALTYEDWLGRCLLNSNGKANLYEVGYQLGGDENWRQNVPQIWNPFAENYSAHLVVLTILRRGIMLGGIDDLQLRFLKEKAEKNPRNALYVASYHLFLDGDMEAAADILLDETLFPAESLPTTANYCTHYLFQKEQESDNWEPCPERDEKWHGVDFMFAAWVITH